MPIPVLLIEDNQMDALVIQEALKTCGHVFDIRSAADGEAALALLDGFHPALVLLDLNIPKVSGLEVLSEIRKRPRGVEVRVVVVTSSDSERDFQAAQRLNVNAYFCKPSNLAEFMNLSEIVRNVLAQP